MNERPTNSEIEAAIMRELEKGHDRTRASLTSSIQRRYGFTGHASISDYDVELALRRLYRRGRIGFYVFARGWFAQRFYCSREFAIACQKSPCVTLTSKGREFLAQERNQ